MNTRFILPGDPTHPVQPPMIYVEKKLVWEYKEVLRNIKKDSLLSEEELNKLGAEGWEMTGILNRPSLVYFYFKRQIEK